MANPAPSFLALLVFLAGGIYVGRSVFPKVHQEREIARRLELLSREVAERGNGGIGTSVAGKGFEKVPAILTAWQSMASGPTAPLPVAEPMLPVAGGENLSAMLSIWEQSPTGGVRAAGAADIGRLWGRLDPEGAIAWSGKLKDAAELSAAHQGMAQGWGGVEPFAASEWVATLPEGPERTAVVSAFVKGAGKVAPQLALGFAITIEDELVRAEVVHGVLRYAAQSCPAEAEAMLRGADLQPRESADFLARLASDLSGGGQP